MTGPGAAEPAFLARGWARSAAIPGVADWAEAVAAQARRLMAAKDADWRCGRTWFAGVNALPNGPDGGAAAFGVPPLPPGVAAFARQTAGVAVEAWDRAQLSAVTPGYPRQDPGETAAAHRYRAARDSAHVDGLLRGGADGTERRPAERHGFVLGLPIAGGGAGRSPMVVWEGSHGLMRAALSRRLGAAPPEDWAAIDVGEDYRAARRVAFETLRRTEILAAPGEVYIVHRLALHGVAPWTAPAPAGQTPARLIAYFRPDPFADQSPAWWLRDP